MDSAADWQVDPLFTAMPGAALGAACGFSVSCFGQPTSPIAAKIPSNAVPFDAMPLACHSGEFDGNLVEAWPTAERGKHCTNSAMLRAVRSSARLVPSVQRSLVAPGKGVRVGFLKRSSMRFLSGALRAASAQV